MRDADIFGDVEPKGGGDADIFVDVPQEQSATVAPPQAAQQPTSYVDDLKAGATRVLGGFVRSGPMGAIASGVGEATRHIDEATDRAAGAAGGAVTDALAPVFSPENAARAGFGANLAIRAAPMVLGGQWAKQAAPTFQAMGRGLMQSAVKPSYEMLRKGKAAEAIETMLKEGVTVSEGGLNKLMSQVNNLDDEVTKAISTSTATVNKGDVGLRLKEVFDDFKMQVNPQSDMEAIKKAWIKFRDHPLLSGKQEMPVQIAQQMKRGTYKTLGEKPYGELQGSEVEAQKALARGLKETISEAVPAVAPLNNRVGNLLNAANVLERRVLMAPNNNILGLTPLGPNPLSWALFMADRMPGLKSLAAQGLYSGARQVPSTAARVGIGYAMMPPENERGALYDLWQ